MFLKGSELSSAAVSESEDNCQDGLASYQIKRVLISSSTADEVPVLKSSLHGGLHDAQLAGSRIPMLRMAPSFDGHDSSFLSASFSVFCIPSRSFPSPLLILSHNCWCRLFASVHVRPTVMKKIVQTSVRAEHFIYYLGSARKKKQ